MPPSAPATQSLAPDRRILPHRFKSRWLVLPLIAALFFAAGWWCAPSFSRSPSAADRQRALRFADEVARHAFTENSRDAYIAAARARQANALLPGMELAVGQMLFNAGHPGAAASYARVARERGERSSASSLVLGLDAWSRRGADPLAVAQAGLFSRLWLDEAANERLSDPAPRFFHAEIGRLAGQPDLAGFAQALHRLQAWDSIVLLEAKMHLAAEEAGGQFNAAQLGRGLRLDVSPQARAVRNLRRIALEGADASEAKQDLTSAFTARHLIMMGGDPALSGFVTPPDHLTSRGPEPSGFPPE